MQRRSLLHPEISYTTEEESENTLRRRTRTRKPRGKRRNTLAGTDQKEIVDALTARYLSILNKECIICSRNSILLYVSQNKNACLYVTAHSFHKI